MADGILKRCNRCGEHKSILDFTKGQGRCRPCFNQHKRERYATDAEYRAKVNAASISWGSANKTKKAELDRAYRLANKDRCYQKTRAWALANPEKHWESQTKSRQVNIDAYRAREAAYRAANRDACNERITEWKKRNPHACVVYENKRRATEALALPEWANLDDIAEIYRKAQEMGAGFHVDHAVPLISDFVCGLHCEANLQIITAGENLKKSNRFWPEMWEPDHSKEHYPDAMR